MSFPIGVLISVQKSEKQKTLERQGCVFQGQESLDNHEIDPIKKCYCGRPLKRKAETPNFFHRVNSAHYVYNFSAVCDHI